MNKTTKNSYNGMVKDISKSKFPNQYYYEGRNIRIIATDTQSTGSITNEKGNTLVVEIPIPTIDYTNKIITYGSKTLSYTTDEINSSLGTSGTQEIIGHSNSRNYVILFTTDNNGFDCIWKLTYDTFELTLMYLRNLEFSNLYPIETINNFENKSIDKVYWIDSKSQMRYLNIYHSIENKDLEELIDVPVTVIDMAGKYSLSEPIIKDILSGGQHTSGMIQYAYNLYRINGSQTKMSPLSKLIPLDKGSRGGGDLNEVVGAIPIVGIDDIDINYTNIKVYAIKYTSYNQVPNIYIIEDKLVPTSRSIEIFDDGGVIGTVSLEEFTFLGSDIIIPKNINSKNNRMFFANYDEVNFDIKLDTRAYSFKSDQTSIVYDDLVLSGGVPSGTPRVITNSFTDDPEDTNDSVNLNYDDYKYNYDGTTYGGEGKYLKYELTQSSLFNPDAKYFKDEEIYRLGIQFYNSYGQISLPSWIADFKSLKGNLQGLYNTLKVTLKSDFYIWLNNPANFPSEYDKPIGYKVLIAERTLNDRTIIANGLLGSMMINDKSTRDTGNPFDPSNLTYIRNKGNELPKLPNILLRNCNQTSLYGNTQPLKRAKHLDDMATLRENSNTEIQRAYYGDRDTSGRFYQYNAMMQLYSPEILFGASIPTSEGLRLRIKGSLKNTYNASWSRKLDPSGTTIETKITDESKALNGISPYYASTVKPITGDPYEPLKFGLIAHPSGETVDRVIHSLFYRTYGDVLNDDEYNANNSIVPFTDDLSVITGTEPDPADPIIKFTSANRAVSIALNTTYADGKVTYTITPEPGYTGVLYSLKIAVDNEGNNIIESLDNVTGTQTIEKLQSLVLPETERVDNYYLLIESNSNFIASVDLNTYAGDSLTADYIEKESLNTIFNVAATGVVTSSFTPSPINTTFGIYGNPELTEKGQNYTSYNNDSNYRYSNSLESFYSDGDTSWNEDGRFGRRIVSVNSYGNKCLTFVAGPNNNTTNHWDRPLLETLFSGVGLTGDNNGLIAEFVKTDAEIYLGNIYGGNSFEDKRRSNYLEIGNYKKINENTNIILSPGDTFVSNFKFLRITSTNQDIISQGIYQYEEIVNYITETSIDLKNRSDLSLNDWDNKFKYEDAEYHKYNTVYSQSDNILTRRNVNYNFKKINSFDTNVIASRLKSAGEIIDSWTDILPNEVLTLDGKYGAVNDLVNYNDELYCLQDKAFSFLSIDPRIQVQGSDGISVELGKGSVLQEYKYISTDSGTLNKWSVVSTPNGIYYFDLLNKSFNLFKGSIAGLSDAKGMHSYFIKNTDESILKVNNPLIKQGISANFDYLNNDVFMTFHEGDTSETISFNDTTQQFISFYDYKPSMFISKGDVLLSTNPENTRLYLQYAGQYNTFYDVKYPSYLTLMINPESDLDCIFNNIEYKSELYINDIDQVNKTLTSVQIWNEYQDSGVIPLVVNKNLSRKFRSWRATLPRQLNSRDRVRNPWIFLKLSMDNPENKKLILHDIITSYTV